MAIILLDMYNVQCACKMLIADRGGGAPGVRLTGLLPTGCLTDFVSVLLQASKGSLSVVQAPSPYNGQQLLQGGGAPSTSQTSSPISPQPSPAGSVASIGSVVRQ